MYSYLNYHTGLVITGSGKSYDNIEIIDNEENIIVNNDNQSNHFNRLYTRY